MRDDQDENVYEQDAEDAQYQFTDEMGETDEPTYRSSGGSSSLMEKVKSMALPLGLVAVIVIVGGYKLLGVFSSSKQETPKLGAASTHFSKVTKTQSQAKQQTSDTSHLGQIASNQQQRQQFPTRQRVQAVSPPGSTSAAISPQPSQMQSSQLQPGQLQPGQLPGDTSQQHGTQQPTRMPGQQQSMSPTPSTPTMQMQQQQPGNGQTTTSQQSMLTPQQRMQMMRQQQATTRRRVTGQMIESKLKDLEKQAKSADDRMQSMEDQLNKINRSLQRLSGSIHSMSRKVHRARPRPGTAPMTTREAYHQETRHLRAASQPAAQYYVQAVIPGRAWLKDPKGATITVGRGDSVPGYGRVEFIEPNSGTVITSSGRRIRYGITEH